MRAPLKHEIRLAQLLLAQSTDCKCQLPKAVVSVVVHDIPGRRGGPRVNGGFTLFFLENHSRSLRRVADNLSVPGRMDSHVFLVEDSTVHELAFLDVIAMDTTPVAVVRSFVSEFVKVWQTYSISKAIDTALGTLSSAIASKPTRLVEFPEFRVFVMDQNICLFAAEELDLAVNPTRVEARATCEEGCIDILRNDKGRFAIDGWLKFEH